MASINKQDELRRYGIERRARVGKGWGWADYLWFEDRQERNRILRGLNAAADQYAKRFPHAHYGRQYRPVNLPGPPKTAAERSAAIRADIIRLSYEGNESYLPMKRKPAGKSLTFTDR